MENTAKVFETNLINGEKREITITFDRHKYYVNPINKEVGDVHLTNGIIRYIFKTVPNCLFYRSNRTKTTTCLSYE